MSSKVYYTAFGIIIPVGVRCSGWDSIISRYRFGIYARVLTIQTHTPVIFLIPLSASFWMGTGRFFLWWISRLVKLTRYLGPRGTSRATPILSLCALMIYTGTLHWTTWADVTTSTCRIGIIFIYFSITDFQPLSF